MKKAEKVEKIIAYGSENISARHRTTFEITKEKNLTKRGDCIIGVRANKSINELDESFKRILKNNNSELEIILKAGDEREIIKARGSENLILNHNTAIVVRKSDFICERTLAIKANKAARDINRELINKLKNPEQKLEVILKASIP